VHTLGWTEETLVQGAADAGLSMPTHAILKRGPVELVEYFLLERYRYAAAASIPTGSKEGKEYIRILADKNVDFTAPFVHCLPPAFALLIDPRNIASTADLTARLADDYCRTAGIQTPRLDWYLERGLAAFLLVATDMHLLGDDSYNYTSTKEFIGRYMATCQVIRDNPSLLVSLMSLVPTLLNSVLDLGATLRTRTKSQDNNSARNTSTNDAQSYSNTESMESQSSGGGDDEQQMYRRDQISNSDIQDNDTPTPAAPDTSQHQR
jgi:rpsU-divergently transcribed protein